MALNPRISLEQWRALQAVVDAGGYAQAAALLHKSQSAVTYAIQRIETLLQVKLFEIAGRKARLTGSGEVLYRRAKGLLEEAESLELAGAHLAAGWESELRLAVEVIFPTWLLLRCFELFAQERPDTRIELYETVLSGTDEALIERRVDLAICSQIPAGFIGDALMPMKFIPAAHPDFYKTIMRFILARLRLAAARAATIFWFPYYSTTGVLCWSIAVGCPMRSRTSRKATTPKKVFTGRRAL